MWGLYIQVDKDVLSPNQPADAEFDETLDHVHFTDQSHKINARFFCVVLFVCFSSRNGFAHRLGN